MGCLKFLVASSGWGPALSVPGFHPSACRDTSCKEGPLAGLEERFLIRPCLAGPAQGATSSLQAGFCTKSLQVGFYRLQGVGCPALAVPWL